MLYEEILFLGIVAMAAIAFFIYDNKRDKKLALERKEYADKVAAAWAASYKNPDSPNYDPARIAAEWAANPTNPDSPNYDPDAEE